MGRWRCVAPSLGAGTRRPPSRLRVRRLYNLTSAQSYKHIGHITHWMFPGESSACSAVVVALR